MNSDLWKKEKFWNKPANKNGSIPMHCLNVLQYYWKFPLQLKKQKIIFGETLFRNLTPISFSFDY